MKTDLIAQFYQTFIQRYGQRLPEKPPVFQALTDVEASKIRLLVLDFDGVMSDNGVWVNAEGEEFVRCSRAEGYGLQLLSAVGIQAMVLSSEANAVVAARCKKLNLPCTQNVADKAVALTQLVDLAGVALDQVAYVGNDVNDIPCLNMVGLPIVVADAEPITWPHARYSTPRLGGHGAVRSVCEWLYAVKISMQVAH